MSVEAYTWALNLAPVPMDTGGKSVKPNSACAFVLVALANHAEPDGRNAFPGVDTIVRYTRLSERTVRTSLDRLEELGVITPCDPAVIAAKIKRADRRPKGFDLNFEMVREDLTDAEMDKIGKDCPWLRPWIEQHRAQRGATTAGRDERGATTAPRDERGAAAAGRDDDGVQPTQDGVQPTQPRGAAAAPEPSYEPSKEPSQLPPDAGASVAAGEQQALDNVTDLAPKADVRSEAERLARAWHDAYVANVAPIAHWRHVAVRNMIEGAIKAGFTEQEIGWALRGLATPLPGAQQWQNALADVRAGRPVGSNRNTGFKHQHTDDNTERERNW